MDEDDQGTIMECVFCDRNQFEERLCGETKDFWIIATLGQITDGGYTLLVPKRHVECLGAMTESEIALMVLVKDTIEIALAKEYGIGAEIVFEHGIVGQTIKHAHLHLMPASCNISNKIVTDFLYQDLTILPIPTAFNLLKKLYCLRKEPYLLWRDGTSLRTKVLWNPPAPLQYLRTVVAEAVGRPERANWRNMDPELDRKLWSETVKRLKPYFK